MASEFTLTPQPIRTSVAAKQLLSQALNVSAFDQADALLFVSVLEGSAGPSATIRMITGMQMDSEDGWVVAGTFTSVTSSLSAFKINVPGLLKYVRWEVSAISGTAPAVTFTISGMLRNK